MFPYDIQSTIHDGILDEKFGKGKWHKIVGGIGCRLPVGFDREKLNSGDASTTNIVVRDAYFSGELSPMLVFEPPAEPEQTTGDDADGDGWDPDYDDEWYDDYLDDYDRQFEEYSSAFRDSLPFMSAPTRSSLFAALPGLSRFADEATGEPLDRDSDGGEE